MQDLTRDLTYVRYAHNGAVDPDLLALSMGSGTALARNYHLACELSRTCVDRGFCYTRDKEGNPIKFKFKGQNRRVVCISLQELGPFLTQGTDSKKNWGLETLHTFLGINNLHIASEQELRAFLRAYQNKIVTEDTRYFALGPSGLIWFHSSWNLNERMFDAWPRTLAEDTLTQESYLVTVRDTDEDFELVFPT